jgi:hypothetical protein
MKAHHIKMQKIITIKPLKQNKMLELFDQNSNYWLQFEESKTSIRTDVVSVLLKGTDNLSEEDKIPEETEFIMSVRDAEYLHAWLTIFLKDKV